MPSCFYPTTKIIPSGGGATHFSWPAPVLARLSAITGDRKYLDFMDREWWITSNLLYDPKTHLFFRDASFLNKHEANGDGMFWSRGTDG